MSGRQFLLSAVALVTGLIILPTDALGQGLGQVVHIPIQGDIELGLAPFVERSLEEAFGSPGAVPEGLELRSDHGPQYTGADCETLCKAWRIEHTLAPVGRPTGNAVAERFIQTLKVELIWARDWESRDELREAVAQWLQVYNHVRPHEALGWLTPAEKRAENLGIDLNQAA